VILSCGALRWGVSRGGNDGSGGRSCGYGGYGLAGFGVALFGGDLETRAILNRMNWVSTIYAELVGGAAFPFFWGYGAAWVR